MSDKLKNHTSEVKKKGEKETATRTKGPEEKKAMVALLVFIMATLEIVFWAKKSYSTEGVFGSNLLQKSG